MNLNETQSDFDFKWQSTSLCAIVHLPTTCAVVINVGIINCVVETPPFRFVVDLLYTSLYSKSSLQQIRSKSTSPQVISVAISSQTVAPKAVSQVGRPPYQSDEIWAAYSRENIKIVATRCQIYFKAKMHQNRF